MCCEGRDCGFCQAVAKCGRARFCGCAGNVCSCSGADMAVMLSSGVVASVIEVFFELCFPHTSDNWMTKSLLSSASSAAATFVIGMIIYSRKCAKQAVPGLDEDDRCCPFYLALMISQLIAAGVSFGVGVGVDTLTETFILDHESGNVVNAIVSPILISTARGFFKSASTGVVGFFRRFCCGSPVEELAEQGVAHVDEREVESLLNESSRPGIIN